MNQVVATRDASAEVQTRELKVMRITKKETTPFTSVQDWLQWVHLTILNTLLLNPSNKPFFLYLINDAWIDGRNGSEDSFIPRRPDSGNSSSCQAPVQVINSYDAISARLNKIDKIKLEEKNNYYY